MKKKKEEECRFYIFKKSDLQFLKNWLLSFLDKTSANYNQFFRLKENYLKKENLLYIIDYKKGNDSFIQDEELIKNKIITKILKPVSFITNENNWFGETCIFKNNETKEEVTYVISRKPFLKKSTEHEIENFIHIFLEQKFEEEFLKPSSIKNLEIHYINDFIHFEHTTYLINFKKNSIRNHPQNYFKDSYFHITFKYHSEDSSLKKGELLFKKNYKFYLKLHYNEDFDEIFLKDIVYNEVDNTCGTILCLQNDTFNLKICTTTYFNGYFQNRISHTLLKYNFKDPSLFFLIKFGVEKILLNSKCKSPKINFLSIFENIDDSKEESSLINKILFKEGNLRFPVNGHVSQDLYILYGYLMGIENIHKIDYASLIYKKAILHKLMAFIDDKENSYTLNCIKKKLTDDDYNNL